MASNSSPYFISILFTIFISFLFLAKKVDSASFKFPTFGPYTNDLTCEGDGFALNGILQLTKIVNNVPFPNSAGRASFSSPIRLWDSKTGKIAGFTTTFSFIVRPTGPGLFGDGIAFFLAPFNSFIPKNSSGGYLGLFSAESALNVYQNRIVAVEFDTFANPWDPLSAHLGINVNSIASATTSPWEIPSAGLTGFATVSYDPEEKLLSAFISYPGRPVNASSNSVSFVVDLRTLLPEWVRVGFSGATGQLVEAHPVLSWSFSSSFN